MRSFSPLPMLVVAVAFAFACPRPAHAIVIDGDFTDWNTIPLAGTSIDNGIVGSADFAELKVTHDASSVYLYYSLHRAENPQASGGGSGVFLAIDSDSNAATGFDIFSLAVIGSEAGWQNDFPFEQATGNFNTGLGLSNATYLASPYNAVTTAVEISIPIIATRNGGGSVFPPGGTIGVMFYTVSDTDFIIGSHTLPEPASFGLVLAGVMMAACRRGARAA